MQTPAQPRWLEALAAWRRGQHAAQRTVDELRQAVLAGCAGETDLEEIREALEALTAECPSQDGTLTQWLEGGDPAQLPPSPERRLSEALATIAIYQDALNDELLDSLEHNGFLHCSLRQPLNQALDHTLGHLLPHAESRP